MIKVFKKDNLNEVLNKKPLILYYSENGACGPSGLFFVVFDDKSCYAYSTYYEKSDMKLIHEIVEYVPELASLLRDEGNYSFKRERQKDEYEFVYLGLGNYGLILEELYDKMHEYEGQYSFGKFKQLVSNNIEGDIKDIYDMVKEEING